MKIKKKAVVLLSGGLDSTVNLYEADQVFDVVQVLTLDYGQKAAIKELQTSKYFTDKLNLNWKSLDLRWLSDISDSSLTGYNSKSSDKTTNELSASEKKIPEGKDVDIESFAKSVESAKSVWVPNRNGLFLNIAGVFADSLNADYIIPGFNKEEAETFPDNSKAFIEASTNAFKYSTRNKAEVFCFTTEMNKIEIVKRAKELKVEISKLWPCYHDSEHWCGRCESCLRFQRACN